MFERFTQRARRAIILAQEEAKRLNHSAVGPEHILLGIIREGEGVASKVLESLNINPERVRVDIESSIGRGEGTSSEEVTFTPRTKKVLELALDEARRLGHNYIGTEHLLLGLIRESEGGAARVLQAMGADLERVRTQTLSHLGEQDRAAYPQRSSKMPAPGSPAWPGPMGTVPLGAPHDPTSRRLDEITRRLDDVHGYIRGLRRELQTDFHSHFWQLAAFVLIVVGLAYAALFFRH